MFPICARSHLALRALKSSSSRDGNGPGDSGGAIESSPMISGGTMRVDLEFVVFEALTIGGQYTMQKTGLQVQRRSGMTHDA